LVRDACAHLSGKTTQRLGVFAVFEQDLKKLWLFIRFITGKRNYLAIFEVSNTSKTA